MPNIIFIFSLPRSGSTLLQKMLASHSKISTTNEPWLLLPMLYPLKSHNTTGNLEYNYAISQQAITNFIDQLPNKKNDYYREVNKFVHLLYEKTSSTHDVYFLDKTPRYYLIIAEIAQAFPESKFIFLFRNPLDVFASICNTWHRGILYLDNYNKMDLNIGPVKLFEGYELLKDKAITAHYEDLAKNPKEEIKNICRYLGVEFEEEMVTSFTNIKLAGNLGDLKINHHYTVHSDSINSWKRFFNSPFRIKAAKRYLASIPEDVLGTMGYKKIVLSQELQSIEINLWNIFNNLYLIFKALWEIVLRRPKDIWRLPLKIFCEKWGMKK